MPEAALKYQFSAICMRVERVGAGAGQRLRKGPLAPERMAETSVLTCQRANARPPPNDRRNGTHFGRRPKRKGAYLQLTSRAALKGPRKKGRSAVRGAHNAPARLNRSAARDKAPGGSVRVRQLAYGRGGCGPSAGLMAAHKVDWQDAACRPSTAYLARPYARPPTAGPVRGRPVAPERGHQSSRAVRYIGI